MWTLAKTDIGEGWLDTEQDVPGPVWQSKEYDKNACMKFYDTPKSLYLETDASGVSLGARLLHIRDGMNCGCDELPDNAAMCPVAFASKSLSSTVWHYSNKGQESLRIWHGLRKIHHYCFAKEVCIITNHKPCSDNNLQGCGHVVPAITLHYVVHSSIYDTHYIQTWPRPVHSGLVIRTTIQKTGTRKSLVWT